jgi:hypothetical protein
MVRGGAGARIAMDGGDAEMDVACHRQVGPRCALWAQARLDLAHTFLREGDLPSRFGRRWITVTENRWIG